MTKFEQLDTMLEQGNGYITTARLQRRASLNPTLPNTPAAENWSVSRMAYTNHAMHGRMICMFSTCATAISFFPTSRRWRSTV